ncbi:lysophospholipid acyltransferase family protein [Candidatus Omnitrophota bacterium]
MSSKKRYKAFQRGLARNGLFFFYWLFGSMPYGIVRFMMHILLAVGFTFTVKQKRIARESLKVAFGQEKTDKEIDALIKKNFQTFGKSMIELSYFLTHPQWVLDKVTIEGKEHLEAAMAQGKGVIAVTAHFGNFPLLMLRCAKEGYETNCIMRPIRDEKLEKFLFKKRKEAGFKTVYAIPRRQCVVNSLKVLRNKELLFIPLDQNFGSSGGVHVEFFGQEAATATGPIVFSMRTGAPILLTFIIRQPDDTHKIVIEPPFELEEGVDESDTIQKNIARLTKIIEGYIRKYPHEWGWMHRRWKTLPPQQKVEEV